MRLYIDTDLEGAVGVHNMPMCLRGDPLFDEGYAGLAADINAAVAGAFEGGADEVVVTDGHGAQGLNWDLVDSRVIRGDYRWIADPTPADRFDAQFIVGQHAMAGTMNAFLDHTQNSRAWFRYCVNGKPTGEAGQDAIWAALYDAPIIFLSGDEAAVAEAHAFFGEIEAVAVKRGVGRNRCIQYDPDECRRKIREAAARAVSDFISGRKKFKVYKPALPAVCELTFTRADYADDAMEHSGRNPERIDARTIRWIANAYNEILP